MGHVKVWELLAVQGYEAYFNKWRGLTHRWGDWNGLYEFLTSFCFFDIPAVKISSQLYADLVTGNQPIEPGDSMDVKHLSVAIPVANFVLTDRKMANRVVALGIDKEWGTKVYCESTIECLFSELEKL